MNRNVSTVDYNISRFFIQMRTRDRVTSACQRWWLWTTVTGDVVTQGHPARGGVSRACTGAPHIAVWQRALWWSPWPKRRRPGFPVEGGRARASLGAALDAGRPWSDLVTNHVVRTVSKVLCLRSLRTSRCCWALPVAVAASRNHTRLQLLLQLACDVCSRWLVRGVDAERIFAGAWQRLWPYGGSEYVKAIDVRAVRAVQVS